MSMYYVQFIDKDSKVPLTSFVIDDKYYNKETGQIKLPAKEKELLDPSLIKDGCSVNVYSLSYEETSLQGQIVNSLGHIIDIPSDIEIKILFDKFNEYDKSEVIGFAFDYDKVI